MAQERMEAGGDSPRRTSEAYDNSLEATLDRAAAATSKVRVVHGANEQYFDNLDGKTVGSVRKSLKEVFNIPGDASALVSGKEVEDDFVLDGGMSLEFFKEAGVKGFNKMTKSFDITDKKQKQEAIDLIESIPQDRITIQSNEELNDTILVDVDSGTIALSPANARSCRRYTRLYPKNN
jgi:hypothetical protein